MSNFSVQKSTQNKGGQVCSCGQHQGKGSSSPRDLALIYNWFRTYQEKRPEWDQNEWHMREYLGSYETAHGRLGEREFIYSQGGLVVV